MEGMQGRPRLPRRSRAALLLRAARVVAREGIGTDHGAYHRRLPSRQPGRGSYAIVFGPARGGGRGKAGEIGRNTAALVETIMRERSHPEQGFRAAVGIIRLVKSYGRDRLEAACGRAPGIGGAPS